MTTSIFLLAAGILMLAFEVVLPGFIVGALGIILILISIAQAYLAEGVGAAGLMFGIGLLFAAITLWVEFWWLPKTRFGRAVILNSAVRGNASGTETPADLKGREGEAVTPLVPTGVVVVDGSRHEAYSESGHLDTGARVRVVGRGNFRLIVSKI